MRCSRPPSPPLPAPARTWKKVASPCAALLLPYDSHLVVRSGGVRRKQDTHTGVHLSSCARVELLRREQALVEELQQRLHGVLVAVHACKARASRGRVRREKAGGGKKPGAVWRHQTCSCNASDALDDGPTSAPSAPEVLCFLAARGSWCSASVQHKAPDPPHAHQQTWRRHQGHLLSPQAESSREVRRAARGKCACIELVGVLGEAFSSSSAPRRVPGINPPRPRTRP